MNDKIREAMQGDMDDFDAVTIKDELIKMTNDTDATGAILILLNADAFTVVGGGRGVIAREAIEAGIQAASLAMRPYFYKSEEQPK